MAAKIAPLLALGVPTWGRVTTAWARAYRHLGGPLGSNMMELEVKDKPIAEARNELMREAVNNRVDFLFMLGDDVLPPGDTIIRLLQRLWDNPHLDLVTGVYWTKGWPSQPYIWKGMQRGPYLDWKAGEFFPVEYAGCDCLMIRMSDRMKALGPDWFATDWLWNPDQGQADKALATEDIYFYTKARRVGIELWADTEVQCLHEDRNSGMLFGLLREMPQAGAELPKLPEGKIDPEGLVTIADVGCGKVQPFFGHYDKVKVLRFDIDPQVQPTYRCDIRHLPVPDQCADLVFSRHALEHFGRAEIVPTLKEWARILRVGGEFQLVVPNLLDAIDRIKQMESAEIEPHPYPWWQLYGEQTDALDYHRNGFTPKRVQLLFERLGIFDDIKVELADDGMNIKATATKVREIAPFIITTEWDAIGEQEGQAINGLAPVAPSEGEKAIAMAVEVDPASVAALFKADGMDTQDGMNAAMETRRHPDELTREEGHAIFETQCQRYLNMSGDEFLRRWDAGEFKSGKEDTKVVHVAKLMALVR